jgi:hypothetical protein
MFFGLWEFVIVSELMQKKKISNPDICCLVSSAIIEETVQVFIVVWMMDITATMGKVRSLWRFTICITMRQREFYLQRM